MKYIIIVPDGASDYPIESLGGRTPLEAAETPYMDLLAREGVVGRVKTIPEGFTPSSDVANLSLLGYDPKIYYTGRGPLEAANLGIKLHTDDVAFRCNLVTEHEGKIVDYSAGHVTSKEAKILITFLNQSMGTEQLTFHAGTSYRNLLVYRHGVSLGLDALRYHAPHDIMDKPIDEYLPQGEAGVLITSLIRKSRTFLLSHEINTVRIDLSENPANMIWLWGCGRRPRMEPFKKKFGIKGAVISAVDLINGIGNLTGLHVITVAGATGYYDTDYLGKAQAALGALADDDFVFVHIEATDEAGHNNDLRMKIACLERIDKLVVGPIFNALKEDDFRLLITPDHPTPVSKRTHTNEPVPFLMFGSGIQPATFSSFCEAEAQNSALYFEKGHELLNYFLSQ